MVTALLISDGIPRKEVSMAMPQSSPSKENSRFDDPVPVSRLCAQARSWQHAKKGPDKK